MADEFNPLTAPAVMPRDVRRIDDKGFPTTAMLDWEQAFKSWTVDQTVKLNTKITTVRDESEFGLAEVNERITTVSNEQIVLAQHVLDVETEVDGNKASISQLFTSVNGLGVQWAIQGYVGGSYGGLVFTGIKRADGVGADFLLEINSNVVINGNLIVTGTIYNAQLSNSAVSRAWADEGATSATITPDFRGTGFLEIYAQFKGDGNAYPAIDQFVLRVREDGNILADTPINHAQNGTGSSAASRYGSTSIVYIRTPSAGTHTYSAEIVKVIGATPITLNGCLIIAKEFSK